MTGDTTRPGEAEAVEAAARVLAHGLGWREPAQLHTDAAEEIVAAVYPVIAAAVREHLLAQVRTWHVYETRDIGGAFLADSVIELLEEGTLL